MTTYTTISEITDSQIRSLQREAAQAGDHKMVAICRLACGDEEMATQTEIKAARAKCVDAINDAAGQS